MDWLSNLDWIKLGCIVGFLVLMYRLLERRLHPNEKILEFGTRTERIRKRLTESRDIALGSLILILALLIVLWSRRH